MLAVGATVLLGTGIAAQYGVSQLNGEKFSMKYVYSTAFAEAKGIWFGATFGQGMAGTVVSNILGRGKWNPAMLAGDVD